MLKFKLTGVECRPVNPVPIRERAASERVLYYPELAYLVSSNWHDCAVDRGVVLERVAFHLTRLRFAALTFDRIYIPLGHLLFQPTDSSAIVVKHLLAHRDFREMVERNLILTDSWDNSYTNDIYSYRQQYLRSIKWPNVPEWDTPLIKVVEQFTLAPRNMKVQSGRLSQDFAAYFDQHSSRSTKKSIHQIKELHKASSFQDVVPFSHERFVLELRRLAKRNQLALPILEATNDLYWDRAEEDYGTAVYHIGGDSRKLPRTSRIGYPNSAPVCSVVYCPSVMEDFLKVFLGNRTTLLTRLPISSFLDLRRWHWKPFANQYHAFLAVLSESLTAVELAQGQVSKDQIAALIKKVVLDSGDVAFAGVTDLVTSLAGLIIGIISKQTSMGPIIRGATNSLSDWENRLTLLILKVRHPDISNFIYITRGELKRFEKEEISQMSSRFKLPIKRWGGRIS